MRAGVLIMIALAFMIAIPGAMATTNSSSYSCNRNTLVPTYNYRLNCADDYCKQVVLPSLISYRYLGHGLDVMGNAYETVDMWEDPGTLAGTAYIEYTHTDPPIGSPAYDGGIDYKISNIVWYAGHPSASIQSLVFKNNSTGFSIFHFYLLTGEKTIADSLPNLDSLYDPILCAAGLNTTSSNVLVWGDSTPPPPPPAGNVTYIALDVRSSTSGSLIQNSDVGIYDWSHAVWRNSTAPTGMTSFDSTGASHEYPLNVGETVLLAAKATGYSQGYLNLTIPWDTYLATINLNPTAVSPGASNTTLQFNVVSNGNGQPIDGASIIVENASLFYGVTKFTTGGGSATFASIPVGSYGATVSRVGYQTVTMNVVGYAGQITTTSISLVAIGSTPTPTGTPAPGTTVTAAPTPDTRTSAQKDQEMMDMIRDSAPGLIAICIIMTMMYLLGYKP